MISVKDFSFDSPGELYCQRKSGRRGMRYRRFTTAVAAIRYEMETLEPGDLLGCTLEVEEKRYGHDLSEE